MWRDQPATRGWRVARCRGPGKRTAEFPHHLAMLFSRNCPGCLCSSSEQHYSQPPKGGNDPNACGQMTREQSAARRTAENRPVAARRPGGPARRGRALATLRRDGEARRKDRGAHDSAALQRPEEAEAQGRKAEPAGVGGPGRGVQGGAGVLANARGPSGVGRARPLIGGGGLTTSRVC